ncbi:MAG: hypothetical protein M1812_008578 [Candelaria pacifica]|nr:MAG: hypothetical protein M1812_008578 [Candelaria pacifica]
MVLGTLGHDTEINDTTLSEGKISHKVVRMWIDEKTGAGMGEIHVMGTQSGQALNSLLRAQVPLQVSTRATGELSSRKSPSGLPIIDEDSYSFQGIDFVSKGGIKSATPKLVEAEAENFHPNVHINPEDIHISSTPNSRIQEPTMSEKLLESLAVEKDQLKNSLTEALNANSKLISERDALRLEKDARQKEVDRISENLDASKAKVTDLESKVADLQTASKTNEKFGDVAKLSEDFQAAKALIETYETDFGTIEELTKAFESAEKMVEQYQQVGSPSYIANIKEEHAEYADLNLPASEIEEKLELLAQYESEASLKDLRTTLKIIEAYTDLGSPEEIEQAFSATDRAIAVLKNKELKADAADIAKKFKMSTDKVEEMLNKLGKAGTVSFLEDFHKEHTIEERYVRSPKSTTETGGKIEETLEESVFGSGKTNAERMLERFAKVTQPSKNIFPSSYE